MHAQERPTPALAGEGRRNLVSLGVAAVVAVVALLVFNAVSPIRFTPDAVVLTIFVFWIAYSLSFLVLTQYTFGRADARTLRAWLSATNSRSRSLALAASAVQWAVLALVAVILVLILPGLLTSVLFLTN